jgi:hypothetical protein
MVTVFCGGRCCDDDVSLESSHLVCFYGRNLFLYT